MKKTFNLIWLAFTVLLCAQSVNAQDDKVVFVRTDLTDNIATLKGVGGTIAVVHGEDGLLVIDDDFEENLGGLLTALKGFSEDAPKFLVNTHWHLDHTGGNAALGVKSVIVAHETVRERLSTRQERKFFNRVDDAKPPEAWPVVTFDHGMTFHMNDQKIDLVHYPHGHTDGDAVIFMTPANIVHMGDMFFVRAFPFIDLESDGDAEGLAKNIGDIIDVLPDDAVVIPGHGPISDKAEMRNYHAMLLDTISIVQGYIDDGMTVNQAMAAGLPEKYEEFGKAFIKEYQYIGILYASLTK